MHSHDRTLLAKLGFADPDRRDRRHDLACHYLAEPQVLEKLGERFLGPLLADVRRPISRRDYCPANRSNFRGYERSELGEIGRSQFEVHVSKGSDQYRTTIGFLDVVIPFVLWTHYEGEAQELSQWKVPEGKTVEGEWKPCKTSFRTFTELCIEVKIGTVGTGDIIRQIRLYRDYHRKDSSIWACATAFSLTPGDIGALRSAGIHHIRLGDGFEQWAAEQDRLGREPGGDDSSVTI